MSTSERFSSSPSPSSYSGRYSPARWWFASPISPRHRRRRYLTHYWRAGANHPAPALAFNYLASIPRLGPRSRGFIQPLEGALRSEKPRHTDRIHFSIGTIYFLPSFFLPLLHSFFKSPETLFFLIIGFRALL